MSKQKVTLVDRARRYLSKMGPAIVVEAIWRVPALRLKRKS